MVLSYTACCITVNSLQRLSQKQIAIIVDDLTVSAGTYEKASLLFLYQFLMVG